MVLSVGRGRGGGGLCYEVGISEVNKLVVQKYRGSLSPLLSFFKCILVKFCDYSPFYCLI